MKIPQKLAYTNVGGIVFLLIFAYALFYLFSARKITPVDMLSMSLQKTLASQSLNYQLEIKSNGQVLSQVNGQLIKPDKVHLKGNIYKSEVEFIRLGETIYMKDIWTKKWIMFEKGKIDKLNLLVMEFSPLELLAYKQVLNVRYKGWEKLAPGKMLIIEGQPVFQKDLPGLKDANFKGTYWLKPGERRIYQAVLEVKKAAPKQIIKVKIKLWDFNQKLEIKSPSA
ncbi:MAG: hypothetical protein STSR0004_01170 [Peptococcaceae bacterium]